MEKIELSKVKPDWESLLQELQAELVKKGSWKDLLVSSTGQTLMEFFAAIGAFNQYYIESSARECFLHTAWRDSSIYAISRMLGVKIGRKIPSSTKVRLENNTGEDVYLIPYNKFNIGGRVFFNRQQMIILKNQTAIIDLFEGEFFKKEIPVNENLKEIHLEEPGFIVADTDLSVFIYDPVTKIGEVWNSTDQPLWVYGPNNKVFFETTTGDGDVVLTFGDGINGTLPPSGKIMEIKYTVTPGASGNRGLAGIKVQWQENHELNGENIEPISGGADEKSPSYYKTYGPHIFKAKSRAITKMDYTAILMSYPNIASVTVQGQRDIAPGDLSWMNVVRICVLPQYSDTLGGTNPNPQSSQWQSLLNWLKPKTHAAVQIQTFNPIKILVDVDVEIAIEPQANASVIKTEVERRINQLFEKGIYSLGKRISVSDIVKACSFQNVDYCIVKTPVEDIIPPDSLHYIALRNQTVNVVYSERTSHSLV